MRITFILFLLCFYSKVQAQLTKPVTVKKNEIFAFDMVYPKDSIVRRIKSLTGTAGIKRVYVARSKITNVLVICDKGTCIKDIEFIIERAINDPHNKTFP